MSILLTDGFETGSIDTGKGWWSGSYGNFGYATSPAPLVGSFSFRAYVTGSGNNYSVWLGTGADITEMFGHMQLHIQTLPDASPGYNLMLGLTDSVGNSIGGISVFNDGTLQLGSILNTVSPTDLMSAGVTYHLWWKFRFHTSDTKIDGQIWFDTQSDRSLVPAGKTASWTNGNVFGGYGKTRSFSLSVTDASASAFIVDDIQVADTDEFAGGGSNRRRRILLAV